MIVKETDHSFYPACPNQLNDWVIVAREVGIGTLPHNCLMLPSKYEVVFLPDISNSGRHPHISDLVSNSVEAVQGV